MERPSTPPIVAADHCLARTVTFILPTHAGDPELAWAQTNVGADPATVRTVPERQELAVVMDPADHYEWELNVASWATPAYVAAVSRSGGLSHPDLAPCDLQERPAGSPDFQDDMVTMMARTMREEW